MQIFPPRRTLLAVACFATAVLTAKTIRAQCTLCVGFTIPIEVSSAPPFSDPLTGLPFASPHPDLGLERRTIFDIDSKLCSACEAAGDIDEIQVTVPNIPLDLSHHPQGADASDANAYAASAAHERAQRTADAAMAGPDLGDRGKEIADDPESYEQRNPVIRPIESGADPLGERERGGDRSTKDSEKENADDPVHPGTGEFRLERKDLELVGIGFPFVFERIYRSRWSYLGPLGWNWTHSYDQKLILSPALGLARADGANCKLERIEWMMGNGSVLRFSMGAEGNFESQPESPYSLEQLASGDFRIVTADGSSLTFSRVAATDFAVLTEIRDLSANFMSLAWETFVDPASGATIPRVHHVVDTLQRVIHFVYGSDNFLDQIIVPALGVEVDFNVDPSKDLTKVINPAGIPETYIYSSGYLETSDYIPTERLESACASACGLDSSCPSETPCANTASEHESACLTACSANGCAGSCRTDCAQDCRSGAENRACSDACDHRCLSDCDRISNDACYQAALGPEVTQRCDTTCLNYCGSKCDSNLVCLGIACYAPAIPPCHYDGAQCFGWSACSAANAAERGSARGFSNVPVSRTGWECDAEECYDCCYNGDDCPSGTCQNGRDCVSSCQEMFWSGGVGIPATQCRMTDAPDGCVQKTGRECINICRNSCDDQCADGCLDNCAAGCDRECADPAWCRNACGIESALTATCENACVDECARTKAHASGRMTFGLTAELNHNLLQIVDAAQSVVLDNIYGEDIFSSDFDRVVVQELGSDLIQYHHFKLNMPGAPPITAAYQSMIDTQPESLDLCATFCPTGAPPGRTGELWVRITGDEYFVLEDRALAGPETSWPVEHTEDLEGYRWYDLARVSSDQGTIDPALHLVSGGLLVETDAGPLSIVEDEGAGFVRFEGLPSTELDAMFGPPGAGHITVLKTSRGWRMHPMRVLGGAILGPSGACSDEFAVLQFSGESPDGLGVKLDPIDACSGAFHVEEMGRPQPDGGDWIGSLTDPRGASTWMPGADGYRRTGISPAGDPWLPGPGDWGTICLDFVSLFTSDESCLTVQGPGGPFDDPSLDAPDCSTHYSHRPDAESAVGRGRYPASLGCGDMIDVPPLPPGGCPGEVYIDPISQPSGTGRQAIFGVTTVQDGNGNYRVFYSDAQGRVLRTVNVSSGARTERMYDERGRLAGMRGAIGDRQCFVYDDEWNVVRSTHLPGPSSVPALNPQIEERLSYSAYGRLHVVYDPESATRELIRHEWNADGTPAQTSYPDLGISIVYEQDAKGRLQRVYGPHATTFIDYDAVTGSVEEVTFDEGGPNQRSRIIVPDVLGRPEEISEPGHPTRSYVWSLDGRMLSTSIVLDPVASTAPLLTTFGYDPAGHLADIYGVETDVHFGRNSRGLVESIRETPHDSAYEFRLECIRHDGRGNRVERIDPEGRKTRFTYDANGDLILTEAGVWADTSGSWDDLCFSSLRDSVPLHSEVTEQITRNNAGQILSIRTGEVAQTGTTWTEDFSYDGFGRTIESKLANGVRTRFAWDRRNRLHWRASYHPSATDLPAGLVGDTPSLTDMNLASSTSFTYDDLSRPLSRSSSWFVDENNFRRTLGSGQVGWITRYLDATNEIEVQRPDGRTSRTALDSLGRPTSVHLPDAVATITYAYTNNGLTVASSGVPSNGTIAETREYAPFGGLKRVLNGAGQTLSSTHFDDLGRPESVSDRNEARTVTYDPFGAIIEVFRSRASGPQERLLTHHRDRSGAVRTMTDGLAHDTAWAYDALERPWKTTYADGKSTTRAYRAGTAAPSQTTEPNGDVRNTEYDAFGEVSRFAGTAATIPPGFLGSAEVTFQRNALGLGRAVSRNEPAPGWEVSLSFVRDSLGAVTSETSSPWTESVVYTRDAFGRAENLQIGSTAIHRTYDPLSRLDRTDLNSILVADFTYGGLGHPTSIDYGNGLRENQTADNEGRLVLAEGYSGATLRFRHQLYYGTDGMLARADRKIGTGATIASMFRTDELGRINAANHNISNPAAMTSGSITDAILSPYLSSGASREVLAFDAADDWTSYQVGTAPATTTSVDAKLAYTSFGGSVTLDDSGKTLRLPDGTEFKYDALGRVVTAKRASGGTYTFSYDALSRLVRSVGPTETIQFQSADEWTVREAPSASGASIYYVPGKGLAPIAVRKSNVTTYNHAAFGERISLTTGSQGIVGERYDYTTFGSPTIRNSSGTIISSSAIGNRLLIAGQPYFGDLALHSFRHRWYRPAWGRFISPDPLGFIDGPNRFAYAGNQPLTNIDPWGLSREDTEPPSMAAIAANAIVLFPLEPILAAERLLLMASSEDGSEKTRNFNEIRQAIRPFPYTDAQQEEVGSAMEAALQTLAGAGLAAAEGGGARAAEKTAESEVKAARGGSERCVGPGCGAPSGVCFVAGTKVRTSGGFVPIESLTIGDRVLTDMDCSSTEVDETSWVSITLEMPNPDGTDDIIDLNILRPSSWLEDRDAVEGSLVEIDLPEMKLQGFGRIILIEDVPPMSQEAGCLVLSTVTHLSGRVLELRFEETETVLEPTAEHHLFSYDIQDWIPAGDLRRGDRVATSDGYATVASIAAKDGVHRVFNLEVETRHIYYVSDLEVLSHNADCPPEGYTRRTPTPGDADFPTRDAAREAAMRNYDVPESTMNDPTLWQETPRYGSNPNTHGTVVETFDANENWVEIEGHTNGHTFHDNQTYELPHYHGTAGEHFCFPWGCD